MGGPHVELRAVTADDHGYLYLMETSSKMAARWRLRGATPSPHEWIQGNATGVLAQFIVCDARSHTRVGLVTAYQPNFQDRHAHIAGLRFQLEGRSPLMMLGFGLFVEYVFRCWNFTKLYLNVAEYNYPQFASGIRHLLALEGRLRDHFYLDGERWDLLILAIHRSTWEAHPRRFLRLAADG